MRNSHHTIPVAGGCGVIGGAPEPGPPLRALRNARFITLAIRAAVSVQLWTR
jgi:hypothetical protein